LLLPLGNLLKSATGSIKRHDVFKDEIELDEFDIVSSAGVLWLTKINMGIWANSKIDLTILCKCDRCLNSYNQRINIESDDIYYNFDYLGKNPEIYDRIDSHEFFLIKDNMIELTESLRQNIFVNLPIKLLCDLNCEGMDKNSKKNNISYTS
tara:strand:- start:25 stop:480 length:456 start_codon:yes stop_codon:yes gene_type:complete